MTSTLKVQNIAHTGGTNAIAIDSSGRITNSVPVYGQASHTTPDQTGVITLDTRQLTSGGVQFTDTDTAIQVPVDGLYMIHFDCLGDTGEGNFQIRIQKNGTNIGSSYTQDVDGANDGVSKTILHVCQANDKIRFVVGDGASHGNSQFNNFFVVKIG